MTDAPTQIPQIVVVCAWYNRAEYIRDTVDSLLTQDFDGFEVVIVNDGSPDPRVREILDSYCDPRLRVIHQENTGFVGAIRRAIAASGAPFIALQGAGDVSFKERLRCQSQYLLRNLACVGVASRSEQVVVSESGVLKTCGVRGHSREKITGRDFLKAKNPFTHGEVMYRREVYEKLTGYREYFRFAQDRDLWLRMADHGHFSLIEAILYQRRIFDSDGVSSSERKTLLQATLSSFARQCAYDREMLGVDFVELFGVHAGLFRRSDKLLSKKMAALSAEYLYLGESRSALFMVRQSMLEKRTVRGAMLYVVVKLTVRWPRLTKFSRWVLGQAGFRDRKMAESVVNDLG